MECDILEFAQRAVKVIKKKKNEVYISKLQKNYIKYYYKKIVKMFETELSVDINALGNNISKAIDLALTVTEKIPKVEISAINTGTMTMTDDYKLESLTIKTQSNRNINTITITLQKDNKGK